jgi:hypothetical protein
MGIQLHNGLGVITAIATQIAWKAHVCLYNIACCVYVMGLCWFTSASYLASYQGTSYQLPGLASYLPCQ